MKIRCLILLLCFYLCYSCGKAFRKEVKDKIQLTDYNIYVMRLCEMRNTLGHKRFFLCNVNKSMAELQTNNDIQVVEELYALQHKNSLEQILYFTTKINTNARKKSGLFNAPLYKDFILVNDIESIYFGELYQGRALSFYAPDEILNFTINPTKVPDGFKVDSILSISGGHNQINGEPIKISKLFGIDISFIKTDRQLGYKKRKQEIVLIGLLELNGRRIAFKTLNNEVKHELSQAKRLKYHPDFREKQSDNLKGLHVYDGFKQKEK